MKNDQTTRLCKKCGTQRPIDHFPVYDSGSGARRHECRFCNKQRVNEHHQANKKHRLDMARKRYAENPAAHWTPERRARANDLARKRNAELRDIVYSNYGGKCACCGESNPLFLTVDHVENNGNAMRKVHGVASSGLYRWIIKKCYPKDFQVLCMNCNFAKARNGGICPHKEGSTTIPKGSTVK